MPSTLPPATTLSSMPPMPATPATVPPCGGAVHSLVAGLAFNNHRLANGGMIQGPSSGTSDSVADVAIGQPVAVSSGEFRVPAAVVQALGEDFFDELVRNYHQPTGKPNGPMLPVAGRAVLAVVTLVMSRSVSTSNVAMASACIVSIVIYFCGRGSRSR